MPVRGDENSSGTILGLGVYYGAQMQVESFGQAGSSLRIFPNNNTNNTALGLYAEFQDSMSDSVKIVYKYTSHPNGYHVVFLKKSDGSYRFGFFENATYTTDETAAANYTEAEVDAKIDLNNASWTGSFDLSSVWPAEGGAAGASGDPFITPLF